MTGLAQETVDKLLDFNQKLDISLLDNVVAAMYSSTGQEQKMAQEVLTTLKEHPDAWTKVGRISKNLTLCLNFYQQVDTILEFSTNQQTKYYALQVF